MFVGTIYKQLPIYLYGKLKFDNNNTQWKVKLNREPNFGKPTFTFETPKRKVNNGSELCRSVI